jgi:hypothetical protein
VFVILQALAPAAALLLSKPGKVQRSDGSPVYLHIATGWRTEIANMARLLKRKEVLLILPFMWQGELAGPLRSDAMWLTVIPSQARSASRSSA